MTVEKDKFPAQGPFESPTVDVVILIALLGLLAYWSLKVIGPFLTVGLWSAILAVALYPLFDWLAEQFGSRRLAATLITLLCLMIVIGPVAWLGFGLIGGVETLMSRLGAELPSVPLPAEPRRAWPVVGAPAYRRTGVPAVDDCGHRSESDPDRSGAEAQAARQQAARHLRNRRIRPSGVHRRHHHRRIPVLPGTAPG